MPKAERRFYLPTVYASGDVLIRGCTPAQLGGFMLNYIHRASEYIEWEPSRSQNCQTFTADAYAFLTGKKDVKPFVAVIQSAYHQRTFSFLYRPSDPSDDKGANAEKRPAKGKIASFKAKITGR